MFRRLAGLARPVVLLVALSACGGASLPPEAKPDAGLLGETIVGQHQCVVEGEARPFVVEWDATDLTTFEAHARRDVVLVKFEGCSLIPLYGCKDDGLAGRLGRYGSPQWTSGGFESLEVDNLDDLYARLPLGVVTLGGRVKRGESLAMSYFVSGLVTSSRDLLYADDVHRVSPNCATATHFVHGYNLGAFSLGQAEQRTGEASAQAMGAELGGSTSSKTKSLRRGGDLASCETESQRDCRVPIRVTLRALEPGSSVKSPALPDAAMGPAPTAPEPSPRASSRSESPAWQADELRRGAGEKLRLGDGQACLDMLDRADKLDPQGSRKQIDRRGLCLMRAGRCDDGRRLYRDYWIGQNSDRSSTESMIDFKVREAADSLCPVADRSPIVQLRIRLDELRTKDPDQCARVAAEVAKLLPKVAPFEKFGPGRRDGAQGLATAVRCLAEAGRCQEAKKWFAVAKQNDVEGQVGSWESWGKACAP